jgi:hypothetical protein
MNNCPLCKDTPLLNNPGSPHCTKIVTQSQGKYRYHFHYVEYETYTIVHDPPFMLDYDKDRNTIKIFQYPNKLLQTFPAQESDLITAYHRLKKLKAFI